jgi:pilus assembly protein CpaE
VYCVVPGKPGCGASTVAAHLAVCARAPGSSRVLLVDTDPLTGSVAFQLKIKGEFHLGDVLHDWKRMDEDLWSRLTVSACGVDVLAAPEGAATRIDVSRQMAGELYAFWRERYETVVLDLPDARAAADSGFAALADTVLLVTTNELAALQATRRALECLDQAGSGRERLRLVLNRYTPATGLKRGDVIKALAVDPFAVLCNDYETIQTALLDGRPAPAASRFSTSIAALLSGLQNKAPEKKRLGWFSLHKHHK